MLNLKIFEWIRDNKEELKKSNSKINNEHFTNLEQLEIFITKDLKEDTRLYKSIKIQTLDVNIPVENQIFGQINYILANINELMELKNVDTDKVFELLHIVQDYFIKNIFHLER